MYHVRMKPYEGEDDYIFVSYAHKDSDFVLPIIDNLHDLGYRLWFDEGIEASAEWPEYIEKHMSDAAAVLAFVTDDFVESPNCRKEITFSLNEHKPLIYVTPETVELRRGLNLQLADQQCIDMSKMPMQRFYQKLAEANVMESCRWKAADGTEIKTHKKRRKKRKKKKEWTLWRVIKTVVISIILFIALCFIIDGASNNDNGGTSLQPTEAAHSWEEDASGAKYCITCGVQTGELKGEQKLLQGKWSSDKVSINGSDASYYVPNSAVVGCTELSLNMSVDGVTGNPFGTYMLYGKDLSGAWRIIGGFDLTEEAKSKKQVFNFKPDTPVSFTALAIALKDPSGVGQYNLDYTIDYTGVIIQQ